MIVQVAGVLDREEVELLVEAGVDWMGIPLRLDIHQPDVTDKQARDLVEHIQGLGRTAVLITYLDKASALIDLVSFLKLTHVQLHGAVEVETCRDLKRRLPQLVVIKSVVFGAHPVEDVLVSAKRLEPFVDWFISDTFDPVTGASGATGKTHDWRCSARLVQSCKRPVMVAGGLNPANVSDAICTTGAAGVDAHTGLEDAMGRKSRGLCRAFVKHARAARSRASLIK